MFSVYFRLNSLSLGGVPSDSVVKNPPANEGDIREAGSIPGSGRSHGVENGNPLQCSCLENSTDRGDWLAAVHWVTKSRTWLSMHARIWDNVWSYCVQWDVPMWKSQCLVYMDITLHLLEAKERSLHICCIQYTCICILAQWLSFVFIFFWNTRHTEKEVHQKISDFHYFKKKFWDSRIFACLSPSPPVIKAACEVLLILYS